MINNENANVRIKEKLDFFIGEQIEIHVKLLDKTFLNGYVQKELKPGIYWFIDRKFTDGVFLFLKDIFEIKEFIEVDKRDGEQKR